MPAGRKHEPLKRTQALTRPRPSRSKKPLPAAARSCSRGSPMWRIPPAGANPSCLYSVAFPYDNRSEGSRPAGEVPGATQEEETWPVAV